MRYSTGPGRSRPARWSRAGCAIVRIARHECQEPTMIMTPSLRKFALTTHVTSSVGWLGAVGAFLALAIAGVGSQDAQILRAAYLAMHVTTWFVIVPLSLAALLTGIV